MELKWDNSPLSRVMFGAQFTQRVPEKIYLRAGYLRAILPGKCFDEYDAMSFNGLIPSLIPLVNSGLENSSILAWVRQHGFLTTTAKENRESITVFKAEAKEIIDLWVKYQQVRQPDLSGLTEWIELYPYYNLEQNPLFYTPFLKNNSIYKHYLLLPYQENKKDYYLRLSGFQYVLDSVMARLKGVSFVEAAHKTDFTIKPALVPQTLIQCLYLHFFEVLSDQSQKVCPVCFDTFQPQRPDRIYCSETCSLTARSRRYRTRKRDSSEENA
ncbi:MAG: hypothetical protein ACM3PE_08640 [Deltaproteobacteria bacterium]